MISQTERYIFCIKNGVRPRDTPAAFGPHETYNRFTRWRCQHVFIQSFAAHYHFR